MIIRAVSSSDEESDGGATGALSMTASTDADATTLSASTAVKLAWLGATIALVALLLLDLAAMANQYFPGSEPPRAVDPFTVFSWALLLWRRQAISIQPATVLNNLLGQIFVCAWIYTRETALAGQRQRASSRRRPGTTEIPACILRSLPWALVVAVLCLGHLASCGYILFALFESNGVRNKFWLGRSSLSSRTAPRV